MSDFWQIINVNKKQEKKMCYDILPFQIIYLYEALFFIYTYPKQYIL